MKYGVPQGGVLSPLLFALFVNDLESFLISPESSAKLTLYADDATVAISASSLDELARTSNDILSKFSEWCKSNHLVVNATKTHYMIFYRKREVPDLNLTLDGNRIERVEQCRFLGLYLDSQLKWTAHVDFVAGKLNSAYYAIVNLKSFMDTKNLLNIYYDLAYSHLSYLILYWGQTTELERLFILQKRIIRKIYTLSPIQSCKQSFQRYKILACLVLLFSVQSCLLKKNLNTFPITSSVHNRNTRSTHLIHIPCYKTTLYRKSPYCFCANFYNALPENLRVIPKLKLCSKEKSRAIFWKKKIMM